MFVIKKTVLHFKDLEGFESFKRNLATVTFKSNSNYNFIFSYLFANGSQKSFIGNWLSSTSFWLVRKGRNYFKFRPNVATIGVFNPKELSLSITSKMPISSIITLLVLSVFLFYIIAYFVAAFVFLFFPLSIIIYFLLMVDEAEGSIAILKEMI